jgi:hypothetical protein
MGKRNKILSEIRGDKDIRYPYPFVNPIIVTKDRGIVDGQFRHRICAEERCQIEYLVLDCSDKDLRSHQFISVLRNIKEEQRKALESFFRKRNVPYRDQIIQSSSTDRMKKFIEFEEHFNCDKDYWETLAHTYVVSDNNYSCASDIKRLFSSSRVNRESLMDKKEIDIFRNLPDTITIYRGMSIAELDSNNFGISWTLKREVAEKFAYGFFHNYDTVHLPHTVMERTIPKKDAVSYFLREHEIIYLGN